MRQQDRGLFLPARWPAPARCHGPVQACNSQTRFPECVMIIIIGLVILVAAVVAGVAGVLSNGGSGHALTHPFAVFGYHVTGSTGTLLLYGIVVGALAMLGLSLLLAGARRTSRRGCASRCDLEQSRRETAAVSQQRDDLLNRAEGAPPDTAGEGAGEGLACACGGA